MRGLLKLSWAESCQQLNSGSIEYFLVYFPHSLIASHLGLMQHFIADNLELAYFQK
jgi:hypothetical protein